MPCSWLLLLITGHWANGFGHPQYVIALVAWCWCHSASIDRIRTKSLCELLQLFTLDFVENCQIWDSGSGLLGNPQNVLITDSTIVVSLSCGLCKNCVKKLTIVHILSVQNNILSANPREGHMKIPVLQKPNSSSLFVGQKDVLDKLWKIFIHCADSRLRHSCLLWGTGGIGKTQICVKFVEEISGRLSHVFWVDASSVESITMSSRGISNISESAAQASCPDGSVKSVLQWMSVLQFFLFCFVYLWLFIIFRSESWRCRFDSLLFDSLLFDSYRCHTIDSLHCRSTDS